MKYVKFIRIDITDRIRPYATRSGIHVPNADLPAGRHGIRLSIADTAGNRSSRNFSVVIDR